MDAWRESHQKLRFRLGEIQLFQVALKGLSLATHFTQLPPTPQDSGLPTAALNRTAQFLVTRSHPARDPLPDISRLAQTLRYVTSRYRRYYVNLEGTFEDYLQTLGGKTRATLKRKVKKFLGEAGPNAFQVFRTPEDMSLFYPRAREISEKTYQERLLGSGLPGHAKYLEQMRALAAEDRASGFLLSLNGTAVAYLYCTIRDGIVFYDYLGFDPDTSHRSPGTVLQYLALENLFAEGRYKMFDFTEGEGQHKALFATGSVACADIYYFPFNFRYRVLVTMHRLFGCLDRALGKLLERAGLKQKLKRLLRRHR